VEDNFPRHERIRFRREEIIDLARLPSAVEQPPMPPRTAARQYGRGGLMAAIVVVILLGGLWAGLNAIGSSAFMSDRIRAQVVSILRRAAGDEIRSVMGPARLALDGTSLVALDFDAIGLSRGTSPDNFLEARELSVGLRLWPLLLGQVELASASVNGARVALDGIATGSGDWAAALRDDRGLIVPDRVIDVTFAGLDRFVGAVRSGATKTVRFQDILLESSRISAARRLRINDALISDEGDAVTLAGTADLDGEPFSFNARIESGATNEAAGFQLAIADGSSVEDESASTTFTIAGQRASSGRPAQLRVALGDKQRTVEIGTRGPLTGTLDLLASLTSGTGKVEIERFNLDVGRSRYAFTGAVGPTPRDAAASPPSYRFELVSDQSVIAPEESPEPAMPAALRLAGTVSSDGRQFDIAEIGVRASSGEAKGRASVRLADGQSPAFSLDVGVQGMSVQQVKQLWPWIAAGGARRWVLTNLFGGTVTQGNVKYDVAAGRLGVKGPLTAQEVSGQFKIEGSRFDTTGKLPPIRDAVGEVRFQGGDVDVVLASGKAFLGDGRSVIARNGLLTVRDEGRDADGVPRIAKMELDLSGPADVVAELATLEPIAVLDRVGLTPQDFSGTAEGRVRSDIPLQRGIGRSELDWGVDLKFRDLSLKKPFDGQLLSDADGTLVIDRQKAVIAAKGKLNGIPAEIDVVRPIGKSDVAASQDIHLVFDDKARAAVAPGLNTILSGPIKVQVQGAADNRRIEADLAAAKIDLPWVGWSKGAGIAAKATFGLSGSGGDLQISDFDLQGKTFSARGTLSVDNGALQSAKFDHVSLTGEDDVAVAVKRSGKAYSVSVNGSSLDARALIKGVNDSVTGSSKQAGSTVTVDAKLQRLRGFGGEALSDVNLQYNAGGSLTLAGVTRSGGAVQIENLMADGKRRIHIVSQDAGALLRFLNVYSRVQGGALQLSLAGDKSLRGRLDIRDFTVVDEPKLGSLVAAPPPGGDRSLSQAANAKIDTSRVKFDKGYAELERGDGSLRIANGVLRGPLIGTTFQGTAYDKQNRMDMTGTFMPAYGLNSIFGDIPVLGALLGNGRDGGLIGLTYRLRGDVKAPKLEVNPLSVIAPGIFRSIFEF